MIIRIIVFGVICRCAVECPSGSCATATDYRLPRNCIFSQDIWTFSVMLRDTFSLGVRENGWKSSLNARTSLLDYLYVRVMRTAGMFSLT